MTQQLKHSPQFLRQRKFMMVLPLLVLPFVCICFVALGGGKGGPNNQASEHAGKGFNMNLPGAHFAKKESILDKLAFYEKADEDSVKRLERIKQDPYHTKPIFPSAEKTDAGGLMMEGISAKPSGHLTTSIGAAPVEDSNANKLLRQLDALKQVLHRPVMPSESAADISHSGDPSVLPSHGPDITRLEKLMQTFKSPDTATADPQLEKLNGMLDKIIQIQHPVSGQQVDTGVAIATAKTAVWPVLSSRQPEAVTDLRLAHLTDSDDLYQDTGGFYSIDETEQTDSAVQNTILAVIPEEQTLVAGATVTLRLTQDALISGITIPRNNLVYGLVSINNDRMLVSISSVRYNRGIYPVSLQVFDMDGLPGIHIPGAITRDVAKESADQGIGSMGLASLDPSIGAQAATAGIQAAKTLISRKLKLVRVSVKAGYQVLLKNTKAVTH